MEIKYQLFPLKEPEYAQLKIPNKVNESILQHLSAIFNSNIMYCISFIKCETERESPNTDLVYNKGA